MRNSEGDERFNTVLDLPGDRRVVLVEAADRASAEQGCEQLFASLRSVCRGFSG
jgi:hypothetical protein